jgi:multisubunit Na+/H+ antiporter MnhB subunit
MNAIRYYIPGIVLILIAIMVVALPEIIVAFMAAVIIMAGIVALYIGHKIRKSKIRFQHEDNWFSNEDILGSGSLRRHFYKDWQRWF